MAKKNNRIPTPTLASFKAAGSPAGGIGASGIARAQAFGLSVDQIRRMAALEGLKFGSAVSIGGENKQYYGKLTPYNQPKPEGGRLVKSPFGNNAPLSWYTKVKNINYVAPPGKGGAAPAAPLAPASAPTQQNGYNPTPLTIGGGGGFTMPEIEFPEAPPQMFAPGGVGAGVEGNAAGFRRKKSSGKLAGLTSKGTGQFKITGQSGKSSGLNIGV